MREIVFGGKNIFIKNIKTQFFRKIAFENGKIYVDGVEEILYEQIYACLHNDKLRNISFIVKSDEFYSSVFVFENEKYFKECLEVIFREMPEMKISAQNKKINGYTAALLAKLEKGIEVEIIDTKEEGNIVECPVCGMQCDPKIPYCMECGVEIL